MATAYTEHALRAEYFFSWRGVSDDARYVRACRPWGGRDVAVAATLIVVGLVLVATRVRPRRAAGPPGEPAPPPET